MTGSGLPGAAASPLAERSNLLSPAEHTKHRRPAPLLSPLGDQQPQLPQLLDGGGSPTRSVRLSGRRDYVEPRRESLGSPRTSASLTKQQTTAWATSRDLSLLNAGGHGITAKGSLVVTIRTSHASAATPSPGTGGRVWCTLYGAQGKSDEVELPRHSRHDFDAGHVGKFPTKVNIAKVRVCVSHCARSQPVPRTTLICLRG